jgi:hypothetical protein
MCKMFKYLAKRGCEDMPIILADNFKVNVKHNYNDVLIHFMNDTFELDIFGSFSRND